MQQPYSECIRSVLIKISAMFWRRILIRSVLTNLFYITREEDSKKLNDHKKPCVIISASGMMEAGRVKHHLANNISDPKNTILIVGYCAPTTLGARIVRGDKEVSILEYLSGKS